MSIIRVKPVEGRVVKDKPSNGKKITGPVTVQATSWIRSRLDCGDLVEVQKAPVKRPPPKQEEAKPDEEESRSSSK